MCLFVIKNQDLPLYEWEVFLCLLYIAFCTAFCTVFIVNSVDCVNATAMVVFITVHGHLESMCIEFFICCECSTTSVANDYCFCNNMFFPIMLTFRRCICISAARKFNCYLTSSFFLWTIRRSSRNSSCSVSNSRNFTATVYFGYFRITGLPYDLRAAILNSIFRIRQAFMPTAISFLIQAPVPK